MVHRVLQRVEGAAFAAYSRSLRLQGRLSGFPSPVVEFGIVKGSALSHGKGEGTRSRWAAIERELPPGPGLAVDIGSHTGFFSNLMAEHGFLTFGFEPSRRLFRVACAAADRFGGRSVAFMPIAIDPANVHCLPDADVVLVLSVFHDWCEAFGLPQSLEMLDVAWKKTRNVLFFEMPNTAENTDVRNFLPAMGASPDAARRYIEDILSRLVDGEVKLLGHFPSDFRGDGERRHLFVVRRRAANGTGERESSAALASTS